MQCRSFHLWLHNSIDIKNTLILELIISLIALKTAIEPIVVEAEQVKEPVTIEEKIEYYFPEEPEIMKKIFKCESEFRQFSVDGSPLQSPTRDFGITQVNEKTWDLKSKELGLDYKNDLDDNLKMARHIYEVQGKTAWVCYGKVVE